MNEHQEPYTAPSSEILTRNGILLDNQKIGGWLRFFWLLNILWVSLFPLYTLALIFLLASDPLGKDELIEYLLYIFEVIPDFIFGILILRLIKNRYKWTPSKIRSLMLWELTCKLLVAGIIYYAYINGLTSEKAYPVLLSFFYYLIWNSYFQKSKRVKVFYNDDKEPET